MNAGTTQVTTPSDREVQVTRVFDAPRDLVFDAWTKPELLKRWLGVFEGWSLDVCEIDLCVGGRVRMEWNGPDGARLAMNAVYTEVTPPESYAGREWYDEAWYPGEALTTTVFSEEDGKTAVTLTIRYESKEARDMAAATGMAEGMSAGFDKLAEVLDEELAR